VSDIKCPTCGQPVDAVEHNARARLSVIRETLGCVPGQTEIAAASARMAEIDRLRAELAVAKAERDELFAVAVEWRDIWNSPRDIDRIVTTCGILDRTEAAVAKANPKPT
jgi:DNA repair exonuclease SbcCD ATPase subunit